MSALFTRLWNCSCGAPEPPEASAARSSACEGNQGNDSGQL